MIADVMSFRIDATQHMRILEPVGSDDIECSFSGFLFENVQDLVCIFLRRPVIERQRDVLIFLAMPWNGIVFLGMLTNVSLVMSPLP